jgi:hypothetical protein
VHRDDEVGVELFSDEVQHASSMMATDGWRLAELQQEKPLAREVERPHRRELDGLSTHRRASCSAPRSACSRAMPEYWTEELGVDLHRGGETRPRVGLVAETQRVEAGVGVQIGDNGSSRNASRLRAAASR